MAIDLTYYEKKSLYRFLGLYLSSILLLLLIIGYLFYQNHARMLINKTKYEMLYQARLIEAQLFEAQMKGEFFHTKEVLIELEPSKFDIAFLDKNFKPLFSQFKTSIKAEKNFYMQNGECFSIVHYPSNGLNVAYIVLRDKELSKELLYLKLKIALMILIAFLVMAGVGFYLSKLFLKPIREKIEAFDKFIEDTTHELNTPISAILMTIQTLKGVEEKKLKRLQASAKRLSTMYDSLSYYLNKEIGQKIEEEFDLKELICERVEQMRIMAEVKNIEIIMQLDPFMIKASKDEIGKIINNLLSNAIKYSYHKGKVTLKLKDGVFTICDEGIGIEQEVIDDIFKRYKRYNKEQGGFGIGLSIVADIAKEYNIKIKVTSKKNQGTCFYLDFNAMKK